MTRTYNCAHAAHQTNASCRRAETLLSCKVVSEIACRIVIPERYGAGKQHKLTTVTVQSRYSRTRGNWNVPCRHNLVRYQKQRANDNVTSHTREERTCVTFAPGVSAARHQPKKLLGVDKTGMHRSTLCHAAQRTSPAALLHNIVHTCQRVSKANEEGRPHTNTMWEASRY
jgi:hypothetical protein